jgi:uncharacterized protein YdiU (UPF0061 family)
MREAGLLPGAVLTRVAASHIRVGTFQFFAARGDEARVRVLADYTLARHDPELVGTPDRYAGLLRAVARRQARLIAQWMNVGFIHGVMNTDNMTLSGETIDYGPCAFIEAYDPGAVFSSIDSGGRYALSNQPLIARWNLARLAETLLPLLGEDAEAAIAQATEVIDAFPGWYAAALLEGRRAKLGLLRPDPTDEALAADFLALLHAGRVDFTSAWRRLGEAAAGDDAQAAKFGYLSGWDAMRQRLEGDGVRPAIFSFQNCADSVRTIPALQHDRDDPEEIDGESEAAVVGHTGHERALTREIDGEHVGVFFGSRAPAVNEKGLRTSGPCA